MYKKCDIIETRTFKFNKEKEFTDKLDVKILDQMNLVSEIIQKEVEKTSKKIEEYIIEELKKHNIKTKKPQYVKSWLTRKRLVIYMSIEGNSTSVWIEKKDKPLCGRGEVIKAGLNARSLLGMSDCILQVTERAYENMSVSDRIYIEQSAKIRRIELKFVKE